jgi:hypothetical protein
MKRILLLLLAGLLAFLVSAPAASAFGLKDVLQMHQDGIADSLIVQKIEYSGKTFHLDADDMRALKEAGVSDEVVSAMLRTEARGDGEDYYDDSYGYGYYSYPHTRLYLGFGLGGYYPYGWHHGAYWYPRYHPYYSNRYHGIYRYRGHYGYWGYMGYRVPTGRWGDTRHREQVGDRIHTGNRGDTGYRERAGSTHPGPGVRTRRR